MGYLNDIKFKFSVSNVCRRMRKMTFELRNGFEREKKLQLSSMNDDLRHSLWNVHEYCFDKISSNKDAGSGKKALNHLLESYWEDFFKQPIFDFRLACYLSQRRDDVRKLYYKLPWYKVYSFIEFTADYLDCFIEGSHQFFIEDCNFYLQRENSAFRFIGDSVSPIISPAEISNIEKGLTIGDEAAQHIASALALLANNGRDQSRESVAQSVAAVEAIVKKVTNKPNAQLGELYKVLPLPSHHQFRQALHNLYNYTSGKDGIRHALTETSEPVSRSLARFMLVTCSAFVNLIRAESELIG